MPEQKLSTWQVLRFKFPENEYVLIEEVSDASGFSRSRSLDFMLINLWESRGLAITGIEQKSNRGDWLKELKNPAKQEKHFKYCDYFYLLTDKEGVAKLEEIPPTWGWYHINEKQILKTMKPAPKLNPVAVTRSFLCAMLRRAANKQNYVHVDSIQTKIEEKAKEMREARSREIEYKIAEYDSLKESVDTFEKASGLKIRNDYFFGSKKIGEAVHVLANNNVKGCYNQISGMTKRIGEIYDVLKKDVEKLQPFVQETEKLLPENETQQS